MINVFIFFCALTASCYAAVDNTTPSPFQCDLDSECSAYQCCSKIPRFMAVGKKRQLIAPISMYVRASCQPYLQQNESCISVIKINGDCGCEPALVCKYFPELDAFNPMNLHLPKPPAHTPTPSKRMIHASPESYKCVPKLH
ncbi:uncharacterized protein LOC117330024 [Pecten maximus]|uniref:uncharacterized protein LOC117330024 n=1 Tax=Pecten maximus TaxID=6579 RepID=UPI0014588FDB|nr:uncharacterized protein LOC117330024 [Pecten maximus]